MTWTLLCQLIVLFFAFSILGWMMEVTLKYFQYHRFINHGFLSVPIAPSAGRASCWSRCWWAAVAALKERRARLRELKHRFLRRDDE